MEEYDIYALLKFSTQMTELRTIYYGRNRLHTKYHEDRWSVYRDSDYMYIRNARLKVLDMEECRKLKENYG